MIALIVLLAFIPFYDFNALVPRLPLDAAPFPPALALLLMFLLNLTRGAARDMHALVAAGKITDSDAVMLGARPVVARIELVVGLVFGSLLLLGGARAAMADSAPMVELAVVCCAVLGYAVVQVHLLAFCVRQALAYRHIAERFPIDLLAPEIHTTISNPLMRFVVVGMTAFSFLLLVHEVAPYPSLQTRVLQVGFLSGLVWSALIVVSLVPVFKLKSRTVAVKVDEIDLVHRALRGEAVAQHTSRLGPQLSDFGLGDLMVYEERLKNLWEWPIRAHVRRLLLFGVLPPLTWVLAAAVEVGFEAVVMGG